MQYQIVSLAALAATAFAAPQAQLSSLPASEALSIFGVLETALPSSLVALALTNQPAAISEISAEFKTATPGWFSSLPSDIQTLLDPTITAAVPIPSHTGPWNSANATLVHNSTASASGAPTNSANGTSSTGGLKSSSGAQSSGPASTSGSHTTGGSSSTGSSSGGATMPTAFYGMGIAGAVGLVGVLAL